MADRPKIKTRKITRDILAKYFRDHELIKLIEDLAFDVSTTLPNAIEGIGNGTPVILPSYTVATLPSADPADQLISVSDGAGNKRLAISDGTNWRWPDGAIVS